MLRHEASLPESLLDRVGGFDFSCFQDGLDRLGEAVGRADVTEFLLGGVRHRTTVVAEVGLLQLLLDLDQFSRPQRRGPR